MTEPVQSGAAGGATNSFEWWVDYLDDLADLAGAINDEDSREGAVDRHQATERLARVLAVDETSEPAVDDRDFVLPAPLGPLDRLGRAARFSPPAARPPAVDGNSAGAPPPYFAPAQPGTVYELPETPALPPPWAGGPGYLPPMQQTVASELTSATGPFVTDRYLQAIARSRGFRVDGTRRRGRVRIIWERLRTRRQEEVFAGVAVVGAVAVAAVVALVVLLHL